MESSPASPLEMSKAQFALQFFIVALDAPTHFDDIDERFEGQVFGQARKPVFRGLRLVLLPFDGLLARASGAI